MKVNENEYQNDIDNFWSKTWKKEDLSLDFTNPTTLFKFKYFLKPVLDKLPMNSSVCELGSGNCQWLLLIHSYRPDLVLYGVDLSDEAMKFAEKYNFEVTRADVRKIPLPDNSYDFVYSWGVIEHMVESEQAFREQLRLSKRFVVADVPYQNALSVIPLKRTIKRRSMSDYQAMIEFGKFYTKKQFKDLIYSAIGNNKFEISFLNNYLVFPTNKIGKVLEKLTPDWLRKKAGHNVGVIIDKNPLSLGKNE